MTLFGFDASDFDWDRGPMDLAAIRAAGISIFTHKATEGTDVVHHHFGDAVARARDAGIPFIGAYMVPRTPGNGGAGSIAAQVAFFLHTVQTAAPWLADFPGVFYQMDTEIWSRNGVVYDHVSPANGHAAGQLVHQKTGAVVLHYAPRWAYGDSIPGDEPLWSSAYGGTSSVMATRYKQAGGDGGPGWDKYSGRVPAVWQFGGGAVKLGTQPGCDINAFRGTVADFANLIGANTMAGFDAADAKVLLDTPVTSGESMRGAISDAAVRAGTITNTQIPALMTTTQQIAAAVQAVDDKVSGGVPSGTVTLDDASVTAVATAVVAMLDAQLSRLGK